MFQNVVNAMDLVGFLDEVKSILLFLEGVFLGYGPTCFNATLKIRWYPKPRASHGNMAVILRRLFYRFYTGKF